MLMRGFGAISVEMVTCSMAIFFQMVKGFGAILVQMVMRGFVAIFVQMVRSFCAILIQEMLDGNICPNGGMLDGNAVEVW